MHAVGLLTEWQYRQLFVELSKKGFRTNQPNPIEREKSQVLEKVFTATQAAGITREQIAEELRISAEDLDRVVSGLI